MGGHNLVATAIGTYLDDAAVVERTFCQVSHSAATAFAIEQHADEMGYVDTGGEGPEVVVPVEMLHVVGHLVETYHDVAAIAFRPASLPQIARNLCHLGYEVPFHVVCRIRLW